VIVDRENNVVGEATRAEMRAGNLPHRATFVIIENLEQGKFYVQKRTLTKDVFPGYFDPCPGGVI
jgi:isopentenyldiphosphate isomerase